MQNWKVILFSAVVFLATLVHCCAQAEPFVCFSPRPAAELEGARVDWASYHPDCENINKISTGLKATALIFSGAGVWAACSLAGVPASIWLEGSALGLQAVDLVIGQLPCESRSRDAEVKALAKQVVCEQLALNGISCAGLRVY